MNDDQDDQDDQIDLRALDPSRDPVRWEGMIAGVLARRRPPSLARQIQAWARLALAFAAALAVGAWVAAARRATPVETEAGAVLAEWAQTGAAPSAEKILEVLGGDRAP